MMLTRRACFIGATLLAMRKPAAADAPRGLSMGLASTSFATVGARIPQELGLYGKHGIAPKFTVLDSANATATAIISKSIDTGVVGAGEIALAAARGQNVLAIAVVYRGFSGSLVLSKPVADKLGVAPTASIEQRLKALDGLVIASPSATGAYTISFKEAAKAAGVSIRFAYMAQPAMVAALESGAIQGFIGGAPFWALPVVKGMAVLWISGPRGDLPAQYIPANTSYVMTMREFAQANPEVIKGITATFAEFVDTFDARRAEIKAVVAKLYPTLDGPTLDLLFDVESQAWKAPPPNAKDMARDIAYVKASTDQPALLDKLDPATLVWNG
jgi:ABC-type nitrate/sulfonate/bicarbonate transport system substrate-binding protein